MEEWEACNRANLFTEGLAYQSKGRLKAPGDLRVLGRYESSLICANLKVGRKRYKAQRYNRLWVGLFVGCDQVRSPTLVLAETAHPRCLMDSRPMKVTNIIRNGREQRFCILRAAIAVLFPVY